MANTTGSRNNGARTGLTPETFTIKAIETLRTPGYKGIHVVFSGFNSAFKLQFPNVDVREVTKAMAERGQIVIVPAKRGAMLYKADEAPARASSDAKAKAALDKIIGAA